ncbi:septum formation protein Maf [Defluviimonas sp. 20V17]|uniref:Nucleoside triphosphate pyrophosphatase n=1 Tax=Allgaiera indica TaxID=765699 RepID=A0AAN4ZXZ1_9RHOB|nr:Maf family nucleotide pyrophosphatase [Allgaiera indica]KDB03627.1 septum formation protein Maf [Defluviimonas sp. 20V17]GHD98256.1 Maf-like protein [Allgaiera indica]SDW50657.1 septum formation protein [Allgaiera indica]
MTDIVLASGSEIRARLLRDAAVPVRVAPVRIDEQAIRDTMTAEAAKPRDIADTLAEMKARKGSDKFPDALVMGCDQVLDFDGKVLSKPHDLDAARAQLRALRGQRHALLSAAVLYESGRPVWRHVGVVRLVMRDFSDAYLEEYLARNWPGIGAAVGAYKLEEEGVRLFSRIEGDYFNVLGLPLIELLGYLGQRGAIAA